MYAISAQVDTTDINVFCAMTVALTHVLFCSVKVSLKGKILFFVIW